MMNALPQAERVEIARLWQKAEASQANNMPAQAERSLRILACLLPAVPDILVRLAVCCAALTRHDVAATAYRRSAIQLPEHVELQRLAAESLWMAGEREQARRQLSGLLHARPLEPSVWQTKALFDRATGEDAAATKALRRALLLAPGDWRQTSETGFVCMKAGERGAAIAWQRRAMRLAPAEDLPPKALADAVRGTMPERRDTPLLRDLLSLAEPGKPWPRSILRPMLGMICAEAAFCQAEEVLAAGEKSAESRLDQVSALLAEAGLPQLLGEAILPDQRLEFFLQRLRQTYLEAWKHSGLTALSAAARTLLEGLAAHCHLHEYSLDENGREAGSRAGLTAAARADGSVAPLMLLACYCRIDRLLPGLPQLKDLPGRFRLRHLETPDRERAAAEAVERLTEISPGISEAVGRQYEENPYPRWQYLPHGAPTGLWPWLGERFPRQASRFEGRTPRPEILIAGCGTGQEACLLALQYPEANITAVDLSRASLGYASLRAAEAGLTNIRFGQADILTLDQLGGRFDLIESVGVLHHMQDPAAGLAVLRTMLRPGGIMHLGFYSRAGRGAVNAARALIHAWGLSADEAGIRAARARLFDLRENRKDLAGLFVSPDYYSMSGCRDLIFHVQETQYDVDGLRELAGSEGLELLGFDLLPDRRAAFDTAFPEDPEAGDWDTIAAFERQIPWAFSEMYRFWLIAPETATDRDDRQERL